MPNTPGTVAFPAALDDAVSLLETRNRGTSTLAAAITGTPATFDLAAGSEGRFPTGAFAVTVEAVVGYPAEIIYVSARAGVTCTIAARGRDGTTAGDHPSGTVVELRVISAHRDLLRDALVATQAKLGYGADSPTAGDFFKGTGAGTSGWSPLNAGEVDAALGYTPLPVGSTTDDIAEGSRQYFTNARARAAVSGTAPITYNSGTGAFGWAGSTSDVPEGTGLYFTNARARAALSGTAPITYSSGTGAIGWNGTTSDVPEGSNLYYTDTRARAAISVQPNIGLTYAAGVIGLTQDLRSGAAPTFLGTNFTGIVASTALTAGSPTSAKFLRGDDTWTVPTTSMVTEGSGLYFTDARARAAVSSGGNGLSYNSSTGVFVPSQDLSSGAAPTFLGTNFTGMVATTGLTATGTANGDSFLRGDNTWATRALHGFLENGGFEVWATSPNATTISGGTLSAINGTVTVASTTGFASSGAILVETEFITYTGTTSTTFTGCARGRLGSTATTHANGVSVEQAINNVDATEGPNRWKTVIPSTSSMGVGRYASTIGVGQYSAVISNLQVAGSNQLKLTFGASPNAINSRDLRNKTVTLSFRVLASVASLVRAFITDSAGTTNGSRNVGTTEEVITVTRTISNVANPSVVIGLDFGNVSGVVEVSEAVLAFGNGAATFLPMHPFLETLLARGTNSTYFFRGDGAWGQISASTLTATGTTDSTTFLRGDNTWANTLTGNFRVDGVVGIGGASQSRYGLLVASSLTASSGRAAGLEFDPALTASGNSDSLYGVIGAPSFNANGKTGLSAYGIGAIAAAGAGFSTAYGVYGEASGATTNWAGYFAGDVKVTLGLNVGTGSAAATGEIIASAAIQSIKSASAGVGGTLFIKNSAGAAVGNVARLAFGGNTGSTSSNDSGIDLSMVNASSGQADLIFYVYSGSARTEQLRILGAGGVTAVAAKIGELVSGYAGFAHTSMYSSSNYALLQSNVGDTFINAASGKTIYFRINNTSYATLDSSTFTALGGLNVGALSGASTGDGYFSGKISVGAVPNASTYALELLKTSSAGASASAVGLYVAGVYTKTANTGNLYSAYMASAFTVNGSVTATRAAQLYLESITATVTGTLTNHNTLYLGTPTNGTTVRVIDSASGAFLTTGGIWTNNPSWASLKRDIRPVAGSELDHLFDWLGSEYRPVRYRYKDERDAEAQLSRYDRDSDYDHFGFLLDDLPPSVREIVCADPAGGISTKDSEGFAFAMLGVAARRITALEREVATLRR